MPAGGHSDDEQSQGNRMLRKVLIALVLAFVGLFATFGVAVAAPATTSPYPAPPAETTTPGTRIVITTPGTTTGRCAPT